MKLLTKNIDASWEPLFDTHQDLLRTILSEVVSENIAPAPARIFRAFEEPVSSYRVVIFGQDPYPGIEVADGLAFSSLPHSPIPASLRNIYKEYESDLGFSAPTSPDLTRWSKSGVMLLNRTLTTTVSERNAHVSTGWRIFTYEVAKFLGERDLIAILWGNFAKELSPLFGSSIESVHPSPLSARKGFFGSRPFSRANQILTAKGLQPIDWKL
jgi:uracil-DNA glycosylase